MDSARVNFTTPEIGEVYKWVSTSGDQWIMRLERKLGTYILRVLAYMGRPSNNSHCIVGNTFTGHMSTGKWTHLPGYEMYMEVT